MPPSFSTKTFQLLHRTIFPQHDDHLRNSLKMEITGPKKTIVNDVNTTNSSASRQYVHLEMLALPRKTVVNVVKTTNSMRSQYSVEVVDPEMLALLRHRLEKPGAEKSTCTGVLSECPRCLHSIEILGRTFTSEGRSYDVELLLTST